MTVQQMRRDIAKVYDGASWKRRVENMPDDQVIAIYYKFLHSGKFYQPACNVGKQLTIADFM